jgi:hypothetical protein
MVRPLEPLGFGTRLWFAWVCFFKILFDAVYAGRIWSADHGLLAAPAPKSPEPLPEPPTPEPARAAPSTDAALQLLALLQREGRLIDFLEEDVTTFPDADVGAAARVVHQGCRKALHDHARVASVRSEAEGARVSVAAGTPAAEVKLVGNVAGEPPFVGVLRHRGWRVEDLSLPTAIDGHDLRVVAPAEVEL